MRRVGYLQNRWETNPALFSLQVLLVKIPRRILLSLIEDTRLSILLCLEIIHKIR